MTTIDRRYGVAEGLAVKAPVKCATTAPITLSGLQTIDTVTVVENDRVLVKNQADQTTNGIYKASSGNWTRDLDFDGALDVVSGTTVLCAGGAQNKYLEFIVTTADPITIGTSSIAFTSIELILLDSGAETILESKSAAIASTRDVNRIAIAYPQGHMLFAKSNSAPSHPGYFVRNDGRIFVATGELLTPEFFGAAGDNTTDDTAAFVAMAEAACGIRWNVRIRMHGVTYKVWPDNTSAGANPQLMLLVQCQNTIVDYNGGAIRAAFTGDGQFPSVLELSQCNETRVLGSWLLGDRSSIQSGTQNINGGATILFISESNGTYIEGMLGLNGFRGVVCQRAPGSAASRSTGISMRGHCEFTNTSYATSFQYDGDHVRIQHYSTHNVERSYVAYGCDDHDVVVEGQDPFANDCYITMPCNTFSENTTSGIKLKYVNRKSTVRGVNVNLDFQQLSSNVATSLGKIDAEIVLDVVMTPGIQNGPVVTVGSYVYSGTPPAFAQSLGDAAHELNLKVSGLVQGDVVSSGSSIIELGTTAQGFGNTIKLNCDLQNLIYPTASGKFKLGSGTLTHFNLGLVRAPNAQFVAEGGSILAVNYNMGDSKFSSYVSALAALSTVTTNSNKLPYFTGTQTANVTDLSAFIRTLLDDADAATAQATLGVPGVPVSVANGGTGDTGTAWSAWTPVVTPNSGSITTYSAAGHYKTIGKTTFFTMTIIMTTNGTGAGNIAATLPLTANNLFACAGRNVVSGKQLSGSCAALSASLGIQNYDNTYPATSGDTLYISGVYEST